jgi:hypothetical protein
MKTIKDHMKADILLLGYTDPQVHSFLDAGVKYFGPAHRLDKHDVQTVKAINNLWGEKAGNIALLHIFLDLHILDDKLIIQIINERR